MLKNAIEMFGWKHLDTIICKVCINKDFANPSLVFWLNLLFSSENIIDY